MDETGLFEASLVGTAGVDNIASGKVLEYCGFTLEDVKNLKVHITSKTIISQLADIISKQMNIRN